MSVNSELMERWFGEVWCITKGVAEAEGLVDELVADDATFNGLGPASLTRSDFKKVRQHFVAKYPDLCIHMTEMVESDDVVSYHAKFSGTHAETNTHVEFVGTAIIRFRDGKVVKTHETWDFASLLMQLGVVSEEDAVHELSPA